MVLCLELWEFDHISNNLEVVRAVAKVNSFRNTNFIDEILLHILEYLEIKTKY